jgi:hypothetical protein
MEFSVAVPGTFMPPGLTRSLSGAAITIGDNFGVSFLGVL